MIIHELSNSITFINFKTSLVIAPQPTSVIMTHCVRKSICDSALGIMKIKSGKNLALDQKSLDQAECSILYCNISKKS